MNYKYNAFISYRHSDLDSKVAEFLLNMLERIRLSRDVREEASSHLEDKNLIIFRDKEELPSTGDLTETLCGHIRDSEHLIVILSENTIDSPWVEKEIRFFLESHNRENLHVIQINGDLNKILPPVLKEIEPYISICTGNSFREIKKKLLAEKLKLAAPLLGIEHVSLRQRQQAYKWKLFSIATVFALILLSSFLVYAFLQNARIQDQYRQTQISRSRYLANISSDLLDQGDRITALQVALEAVPKSEDDKLHPLVDEAYYALNRALYSYQRSGFYEFFPVHKMSRSSSGFQDDSSCSMNPDQTRLALIAQNGDINIFDLSKKELLMHGTLDDMLENSPENIENVFENNTQKKAEAQKVLYLSNEELCIFTEDEAILFAPDDKQVLWRKSYMSSETETNSWNTLIRSDVNAMLVNDRQNLLTVSNTNKGIEILILQCDTGEIVFRNMIENSGNASYSDRLELVPSPDEKKFLIANYNSSQNGNSIFEFDLQSYSIRRIFDEDRCLLSVTYTSNAQPTAIWMESTDEGDNKLYLTGYKLISDNVEIQWDQELSDLKYQYGTNYILFTVSKDGEDSLLLATYDQCLLLNQDDGRILSTLSVDPIAAITRQGNSTNRFYAVLKDGSISQIICGNSDISSFAAGKLEASVETAVFSENNMEYYLFDQNTTTIWVYSNQIQDKNGITQEPDDRSYSQYGYAMAGQEEYRYVTSCSSNDSQNKNYRISIYRQGETEPLAESPEYEAVSVCHIITLSDETLPILIYQYIEENAVYLAAWDILNNSMLYDKPLMKWPEEEHASLYNLNYCGSWNDMIAVVYDNNLYIVNLTDGTEPLAYELFDDGILYHASLSEQSGKFLFIWHPYGLVGNIRIASLLDVDQLESITSLKDCPSIPLKYSSGLSAFTSEISPDGNTLLLSDGGVLKVYDLQTLNCLQNIRVSCYNKGYASYLDEDKIVVYGDDQLLMVWSIEKEDFIYVDSRQLTGVKSVQVIENTVGVSSIGNYGNEAHLYRINEDGTLSHYLFIKNGLCNVTATEIATLYTEKDKEIMTIYPVYSLKELLEHAEKVLEDHPITEQDTRRYYISE